MAVQTQVYIEQALGVPGGKVVPGQSVYLPYNPVVVDDDGISVGRFVFRPSDVDNGATATGGTADTLLGFAERVIAYPVYDVTVDGTLAAPKNSTLTVAVHGDYYVAAPATVAAGDAVTCDETGAVVSGGAVETGWVYRTAGDEGDIVIISGWTKGD